MELTQRNFSPGDTKYSLLAKLFACMQDFTNLTHHIFCKLMLHSILQSSILNPEELLSRWHSILPSGKALCLHAEWAISRILPIFFVSLMLFSLIYSLEYIGEVLAVLAARAGWELIILQQQSKHLFKLHITKTYTTLNKLSHFTQVSLTYNCREDQKLEERRFAEIKTLLEFCLRLNVALQIFDCMLASHSKVYS